MSTHIRWKSIENHRESIKGESIATSFWFWIYCKFIVHLLQFHRESIAKSIINKIWVHAQEIFSNPKHSYTQSLLASTPSVVGDKIKLKSLHGEPPSLISEEIGCSFASRCPNRDISCNPSLDMELVEVSKDHFVDICNAESDTKWRKI